MILSLLKRIFIFNDSHNGDSRDDKSSQRPAPSGRPTTDLEQSWQNLGQGFTNIFSKKKNGPNRPSSGGSQKPNNGMPKISFTMVGGIILTIWLGTGFYIVKEGEVAVVTQFGRYYGTTQAGFNWRLPSPIQSHAIVNVAQLRTIEIGVRGAEGSRASGESLMITDDQNLVDLQFVVQYRLRADGARDYLFANRDPNGAVIEAAETAMREVVGRKTMDFVLYEGRTQIAVEVVKLMQQLMDKYRTGILINNVAIQNAQPPEQVQAAFDDAVKAGQDRERQINEGEAYANSVVPLAQGMASRLLEEAQGYQEQVVARAEGDASRFNAIVTEYKKSPQVTRDRIYIDTMKQVFANTNKVYIDAKGGNNLLYLPLDKLMQKVTEDAQKTAESSALNSPSTRSETTSNTPGIPAPAVANPSPDSSVPRTLSRERAR